MNSGGGFGLAAERLIRVCRQYSSNGFEVLMPNMAKSAATIVCFGSNKIWMGESSELGPVDPQLPVKRNYLSCHNIVSSYDRLLEKAVKSKGNVEPFLHQLRVYDPREIAHFRQEIALSEQMSVKLLQTGMMKGKSVPSIKKCIRMFVDPKETLEHGRPIYHHDADRCGLNIGIIKSSDPIWETIWELQIRYSHVLTKFYGKVVESSEDSFTLHGHVHRSRLHSEED